MVRIRIREFRNMKKISGPRLAAKLSITPTQLYDMEKGRRRIHAEMLSDIADILETTTDSLLGRPEKSNDMLSNMPTKLIEFIQDTQNTQWIQLGMLAKESGLSYETIRTLLIEVPGAGQHRNVG